jgi:acyl dehydratase
MTANTPTGLSLVNIRGFIGKQLGVSAWETLGQPRINHFAECTGDNQWIHVDAERAQRESPYRSTIAHGYLLLSLLAPTTLEVIIKPAGIKAALNYGINRVRFIAPVKAGGRVRNRIKLVGVEDKGNGRKLLTTENTLEIDGGDKPALIALVLSMVLA